MSLRKSPTLTPARIEGNRSNSRKSTGPRTARGKGQSRMNSLRAGGRSRFMRDLYLTLLDVPPCSADRVARALLTPEQAAHPLFAGTVDMFRQAEIEVVLGQREILAKVESRKSLEDGAGRRPPGAECAPSAGERRSAPRYAKRILLKNCERSLNVAENTV